MKRLGSSGLFKLNQNALYFGFVLLLVGMIFVRFNQIPKVFEQVNVNKNLQQGVDMSSKGHSEAENDNNNNNNNEPIPPRVDILEEFHQVASATTAIGFMEDLDVWPAVKGAYVPRVLSSSSDEPSSLVFTLAEDFHFTTKGGLFPQLRESFSLFEEIIKENLRLPKCAKSVAISSLVILVVEATFEENPPIPTIANEQYELFFSSKGGAVLRVNSRFGVVKGLATFVQLISKYKKCLKMQFVKPLFIKDSPAFEYRGFLLDTARNFFEVDAILRLIRVLSLAKMNVLHWHFVDDQSYGFESKVRPEVTLSSYPKQNKFYTLEEVKLVVEEGRKWGVRIIPELDMPSHAAGWVKIPAMIAKCPHYACRTAWGIAMNPYATETWVVLEQILTEIAGLFPDPVFHLGGDEVFKECWFEDPAITYFSRDGDAIWTEFERKLNKIVKKLKKKTIRWEDSVRFYQAAVHDKDVTFQLWGSYHHAKSMIGSGYGVISSLGYYFDNDCFSWDACYKVQNPIQRLLFSGEELKNPQVKGMEACAWELSESMFDTQNVWMRLIAVAEHMWSSPDRSSFRSVNSMTAKRITHFCEMLSKEFGLFPDKLCTEEENRDKGRVKQGREFQIREAERDEMICRRMTKDTSIRCGTANCNREGTQAGVGYNAMPKFVKEVKTF